MNHAANAALPEWWRRALAQGVLPADAQVQQQAGPSWVVMGLSFWGAQLALWPFMVFLALWSWQWLFEPPGAWLLTLALAAAALTLLRRGGSLWVQQLGLNLVLAAQVLWMVGWRQHWTGAALLGLLVLQLGMALGCRVAWVQRLLGMLASWTFFALPLWLGSAQQDRSLWRQWEQWQALWPSHVWALALLWLLWLHWQGRLLTRSWAGALAALMDGAVVGLLLALAVRGGVVAVLLGAGAQGSADVLDAGGLQWWRWGWPQLAQVALLLLGALWLWWQWRPQGRGAALLGVVFAALALACAVVPHLGALALVGASAAATGRRRLLWLSGAVLLLGLGNFYYALAWPLLHKAGLLAALGMGLALALWWLRQRGAAAGAPAALPKWQVFGLAVATVLALALVHQDVQRKEQVITQGQKIYLPLVPRDPRSLLQGDYMALNFALPPEVTLALQARQQRQPWLRRVLVRAQLDGRGVAQVLAVADVDGPALAPGQIVLPLQQLKGQWVVVTDAFFFPEGQGRALAGARFGEFRVLPSGQALLVGLADAQLRALAPGRSKSDSPLGFAE